MRRMKVFISSVQAEFSSEREMLYDYLATDALFGRFFEPFIFEKTPAANRRADTIYLEEVQRCDIYTQTRMKFALMFRKTRPAVIWLGLNAGYL